MTEENPFAGQGAVMLDIGGDVGALIVVMPNDMAGVEVEIRPAGSGPYFAAPGSEPDPDTDPGAEGTGHGHTHGHGHGHSHEVGSGHLPHVAVVERPLGQFMVPSLVYPEVVEGSYELCLKGSDEVVMSADVRGGEVTETRWPGA